MFIFRVKDSITKEYIESYNLLQGSITYTGQEHMARIFEGAGWHNFWSEFGGHDVEKVGYKKVMPFTGLELSNEQWRHHAKTLNLDSLWTIQSRDAKPPHAEQFHGLFVPAIARQIIKRYSGLGEVVLDPFLGSGTTAIEALKLGRAIAGVELNQAYIEDLLFRLTHSWASHLLEDYTSFICGSLTRKSTQNTLADQLHLLSPGDGMADLAILHPPYFNIIQFSSNSEDLSMASSKEKFLEMFGQIVEQVYERLRVNRIMALVIGDYYQNGEYHALGFECMERCRYEGFKLRSMIVKDIQGNEQGKGKNQNLWKYRALAGGYHLFKHEYIFIFEK